MCRDSVGDVNYKYAKICEYVFMQMYESCCLSGVYLCILPHDMKCWFNVSQAAVTTVNELA